MFCNSLCDSQSQSVAALCPIPGGVRPVKALEQMGQVLRRDGFAGIADGKPQLVLLPCQGHLHRAAFTGVFDRVVQ